MVHGCKKFVPALAYLRCLAVPGSCLAYVAYFLADICTKQCLFAGQQLRESRVALCLAAQLHFTQFLPYK